MQATRYFWDCECAANYIHPKILASCPRCAAVAEGHPDSHLVEVMEMPLGQLDAGMKVLPCPTPTST